VREEQTELYKQNLEELRLSLLEGEIKSKSKE
jgi:hypothetical protein